LTVVRDFLTDWYALWRDDAGQKRRLDMAQARFEAWRQDGASIGGTIPTVANRCRWICARCSGVMTMSAGSAAGGQN
jgi:hypothetical protein